MNTINISLPQQLYDQVESLIHEEGFASRSEFFRTLIRTYSMIKKGNVDLLPFETKPLSDIRYELKKEQRYNKKFISSVVEGLSKSSVYARQTVAKRSSKTPAKISANR